MATNSDGEGAKTSVFATLQALGLSAETVPYMEKESRSDGARGVFCKNLFLKDRKGKYYLIVCPEDKEVDLKWLKRELNAYRNFSFANADDLLRLLGVVPGAVTPLVLHPEIATTVQLVMDQSLTVNGELLNFHPGDPNLTTLISFQDLLVYLQHRGYEPLIINLQAS